MGLLDGGMRRSRGRLRGLEQQVEALSSRADQRFVGGPTASLGDSLRPIEEFFVQDADGVPGRLVVDVRAGTVAVEEI